MSEALTGNVLVAQLGDPTAVMNASLAGVVSEALNHDCIEEIYGALNGIQGLMNESLVDLAEESQQVIRGLRYTPGAALGRSRYSIKSAEDYERILEVLKAHDIHYFFPVGANESQETTHQIAKLAEDRGYPLRVIGIPKSVENQLPVTDHCPGYGSIVKYLATTIREMALDHQATGEPDLVSIVEVMGRNSGWVAAGASMAKYRNQAEDPPHIILLPEIAFEPERFLYSVQESLKKYRFCMIVLGEGLVDANGNYLGLSNPADPLSDSLGGGAEYLYQLLEERLGGGQIRTNKLGVAQRAAAHCASQTDNNEAYQCGCVAVQNAVAGETDKMVTLVRAESEQYGCEMGLVPLGAIADQAKPFPPSWINDDGLSLSHHYHKYASPLIQGEVQVPFDNGTPDFVSINGNSIPKKLLA